MRSKHIINSAVLNNAELFQNVLDFIEVIKKEIYKSATLQHSISATLKNLLVMKEFSPIIDHFEIGNWLRCRVDGKLNLLRLVEYEINFEDLDNLSVTFSDIKIVAGGVSDVESILNQSSSMAISYSSVKRQAQQGEKSNKTLENWVDNGFSATNTKIIGGTQILDGHGMLFRNRVFVDTQDYISTTVALMECKEYAKSAIDSADAAKSAEKNAKSSETNAEHSAAAASSSETNAQSSAAAAKEIYDKISAMTGSVRWGDLNGANS